MPMPKEEVSWLELVNEYGTYHLTRMQADKKTRPLAESFKKRQDVLEERGIAFIAAKRAQVAAEAAYAGYDLEIDTMIKELYFTKLTACGNNRSDESFSRWFPEGLSEMIRKNQTVDIGHARDLILVLSETPDDPIVAHYIPGLSAAAESCTEALDDCKLRVSKAEEASRLVEEEKNNWHAAYTKDHAEILSLFSGNKRIADSFFKAGPESSF